MPGLQRWLALARVAAGAASAQYVKITSLATHAGELCDRDRAAAGKVRPGSRMAASVAGVRGIPVHMALSGRTMEFDGGAKRVAGS